MGSLPLGRDFADSMVDDAVWPLRTSYSMHSMNKYSLALVRASFAGQMFSEPSSHSVVNELSDESNNGSGFVVDGTMAVVGHSPVIQLPFAGAFAWALIAVADGALIAFADGRCCAVRIIVVADGSVSAEALADSVRVRPTRLALAVVVVVVLHIV